VRRGYSCSRGVRWCRAQVNKVHLNQRFGSDVERPRVVTEARDVICILTRSADFTLEGEMAPQRAVQTEYLFQLNHATLGREKMAKSLQGIAESNERPLSTH